MFAILNGNRVKAVCNVIEVTTLPPLPSPRLKATRSSN